MSNIISTQDMIFAQQDTHWSQDRAYRYFLRRSWQQQCEQGFVNAARQQDLFEADKPAQAPHELRKRAPIAFILLNPSTADERKDDPTVARCRRFAVAWGFGEVIILNAFAFRATDPKDMKACPQPVGEENDAVILKTLTAIQACGGQVVCGWGNHGKFLERGQAVRTLLRDQSGVMGFPKTKLGEPSHPLYLPKSVALSPL